MPGAVRFGDKAVAIDSHGRRCCPHYVIGGSSTITGGSPNVFINGRKAVRLGDLGLHSACCGPNIFTHIQASTNVFVNSKGLVKLGDKTRHCGGIGAVIEASQNVLVN